MDDELADTRNCYQGWSADKQRMFLRQLAASGSVTRAAEAVGMTARAAYYLRNRPQAKAFREGWALALRAASDTLVAVAYDRAINGAQQKYWQDGKLIGERLVPSDRMLMWLLARTQPDIPTCPWDRHEKKWEELEAKMPALTQVPPTQDEEDEAIRLTPQTPDPQQALPAPTPTPGQTPKRPHPHPRTHESA